MLREFLLGLGDPIPCGLEASRSKSEKNPHSPLAIHLLSAIAWQGCEPPSKERLLRGHV